MLLAIPVAGATHGSTTTPGGDAHSDGLHTIGHLQLPGHRGTGTGGGHEDLLRHLETEGLVQRRVREGVEELEPRRTLHPLLQGVDLGGDGDAVPFPEVARQVGHHHQRPLGDRFPLEAGELQGRGVGQSQHLPAGERIRHGEAQHDVPVAVGELIGQEEGRFAEVRAHQGWRLGSGTCFRTWCFSLVLGLLRCVHVFIREPLGSTAHHHGVHGVEHPSSGEPVGVEGGIGVPRHVHTERLPPHRPPSGHTERPHLIPGKAWPMDRPQVGHLPGMGYEGVERGVVHPGQELRGHRLASGTFDRHAPFFLIPGAQLVAEGHPFHLQLLVAPRHGDRHASAMRPTPLHAQEMHGEATPVAFLHGQFDALLALAQGEPAAHRDRTSALHLHQNRGLVQAGAQQQDGLPARLHPGLHGFHVHGLRVEAGPLDVRVVQGEGAANGQFGAVAILRGNGDAVGADAPTPDVGQRKRSSHLIPFQHHRLGRPGHGVGLVVVGVVREQPGVLTAVQHEAVGAFPDAFAQQLSTGWRHAFDGDGCRELQGLAVEVAHPHGEAVGLGP